MRDLLTIHAGPWAIDEGDFDVFSHSAEDFARAAEKGGNSEVERLTVDEAGLGQLTIAGPLMPSPTPIARGLMGAVDSARLEKLVREAQDRPSVRALLINIDSPGGAYTGTPELGNAIAELAKHKPVTVFSSGTVASAAYWIAVPATRLLGTQSSRWGSIGVLRAHTDITEARRKEGISVDVFKSGDRKAPGAFSTSLSSEESERIQAEVNRVGGKFLEHVQTHRPGVARSARDGRVFDGTGALEARLIDQVVANFDEAVVYAIESFEDDSTKRKRGSFDKLSASELWEVYAEVLEDCGHSTARFFYESEIAPRL